MAALKIEEVKKIICDAGGKIVGRTRLQKVAYLLNATGLDDSFRFAYKHYGPFSEDLASSAKLGALFGSLEERQASASWGGTYSTYTAEAVQDGSQNEARTSLASVAAEADSIVLELAATAVFLFYEGYGDPWEETAQRKPEKATGDRLLNARNLLKELAAVDVPKPIPEALYG
ncbi:hypothetical protein [Rhodovulum visakhapatnamense]|uniref:Uncharacterized protein n=1 Tax=Rhodovulum visakhapatnamense TaxID=364297 RepID=A0A4R8FV25_9RHOB|nr:hypothetical protein [Rhodovulum visakhapatnamense]TDX28028.1 hypothetical protein EV657_113109 [Rhodovulum visakhapatnamense]